MSKYDYGRADVIDILIRRDGTPLQGVLDTLEEMRKEMQSAIENGEFDLAEQIFQDATGLEPDYMMAFID